MRVSLVYIGHNYISKLVRSVQMKMFTLLCVHKVLCIKGGGRKESATGSDIDDFISRKLLRDN